jgi:LmbE family N-acetylglucosaminyl deacetylase
MNNVLIIGAHFDDAELGAGGTAAKLVSEGKKVYKLTLTDNATKFTQKNINVDYDSSKRIGHIRYQYILVY